MKRALIQENPSHVILALGANDGLRGLSLSQTEENLRQMIRLAKSHGARVLLVGIALPPNYGEDFTKRFAAIYPRLARELAVPLVPFMLEGFATDLSYFQADRIHPNERAQPVILETILAGLAPMLRGTP
jgi:acyl-CoA thioesterase-1